MALAISARKASERRRSGLTLLIASHVSDGVLPSFSPHTEIVRSAIIHEYKKSNCE